MRRLTASATIGQTDERHYRAERRARPSGGETSPRSSVDHLREQWGEAENEKSREPVGRRTKRVTVGAKKRRREGGAGAARRCSVALDEDALAGTLFGS